MLSVELADVTRADHVQNSKLAFYHSHLIVELEHIIEFYSGQDDTNIKIDISRFTY